jgi:hypothetical protein
MYNTNNNILYIKTLNYYKNNNIITQIIIISLTWICWIIRKIIIFITQIIKLRNPRILITQIIIFFILITRIIIKIKIFIIQLKTQEHWVLTQDPSQLGSDAGVQGRASQASGGCSLERGLPNAQAWQPNVRCPQP